MILARVRRCGGRSSRHATCESARSHPLPPDQCQTDHHGDGHRCPCTCCRGVSAGNVRTNPGAGMSETRLIDEPTIPTMGHKIAAEALGTFVLVFGGCGAAVLAANGRPPGAPVCRLGVG